jgi:hypothetical protein
MQYVNTPLELKQLHGPKVERGRIHESNFLVAEKTLESNAA